MRVLISLVSSIALAALFAGCGGGQKEDTTPAANEAAPAEGEGEGGAEAEGAEGEGEAPQEEAAPSEEPSGGGGW